MPALGRIELFARQERHTDVVHRHLRAVRGLVAVTDHDVLDDQVERDIAVRLVDLGPLEAHASAAFFESLEPLSDDLESDDEPPSDDDPPSFGGCFDLRP